MTAPLYALIGFVLLCGLGAVNWVLGWWFDDDMAPLPTGRFLVMQGRNTYQCDTEAEAAEMALRYSGVTRVERRHR